MNQAGVVTEKVWFNFDRTDALGALRGARLHARQTVKRKAE